MNKPRFQRGGPGHRLADVGRFGTGDAVLCPDGGNGYKNLAAARGIEHFVVGSKPGTRVAAACHRIQNVNPLHARYNRFIKPVRGPATKNSYGYIRWLDVLLAGIRPLMSSELHGVLSLLSGAGSEPGLPDAGSA